MYIIADSIFSKFASVDKKTCIHARIKPGHADVYIIADSIFSKFASVDKKTCVHARIIWSC